MFACLFRCRRGVRNQPAEEGGGGAEVMVREGALQRPDVDEIYGLHLYNYHQLGYVGVKHGPIMASSCRSDAAARRRMTKCALCLR